MDLELGLVIPTYFAETVPSEVRRSLMASALEGLATVADPENCVIVLDGAPWLASDVAACVASAAGGRGAVPEVVQLEVNLGKGGAVAAGLNYLLTREVSVCATVDCDGEHRLRDIPALVELLHLVCDHTERHLVEVVGRRYARHWSLGAVRGELEGVTSRVVFSALRFALARDRGEALDETWVAPYGEPDLEAGLRVYTRAAAAIACRALTDAASVDPRLYRWGVEVVPTVEIVLAGGVHAEGMRSTLQGETASSYAAGCSLAEVFSTELLWILRRCEVPALAASLMLEDAFLRGALLTHQDGALCAQEIRASVLSQLPGGEEALRRTMRGRARRL